MADDNLLLNAIQTGANIGNMRAMRQERMMELQSQEALRQIQERHLAAQADMLSYNLDQAKADKAKEDADLQKADMMHKVLTETVDPGDKTPEEVNQLATQATDDWLVRNNPKAALKVANARFLMSKPEIAQQTLKTREAIAQTGAEAKLGAAGIAAGSRETVADINAKSREKVASTRAPLGYAPSVSEKDALALQKAADAVDKEYADPAATPESIARAEKFEENLRNSIERQHPDKIVVQEAQAIRNELGIVLKEYWSGGRDEKLVPKINELKDQLKGIIAQGRKGAQEPGPAPVANAPAAPSTHPVQRFSLDPKTGKLVPIKPNTQ